MYAATFNYSSCFHCYSRITVVQLMAANVKLLATTVEKKKNDLILVIEL